MANRKYKKGQTVYAKVSTCNNGCYVKQGEKLEVYYYGSNGVYVCKVSNGKFLNMKTAQLSGTLMTIKDGDLVKVVNKNHHCYGQIGEAYHFGPTEKLKVQFGTKSEYMYPSHLKKVKEKPTKISLKIPGNSSRDTAIHCPTEELAKQVLAIFHEAGLKWCSGESYLKASTEWSTYKDETCYSCFPYRSNDGRGGGFGPISFYKKENYNVVSAKDFIEANTPKTEVPKYKSGDKVRVVSNTCINHHLLLGSVATVVSTGTESLFLRGTGNNGKAIGQSVSMVDVEPYTEPTPTLKYTKDNVVGVQFRCHKNPTTPQEAIVYTVRECIEDTNRVTITWSSPLAGPCSSTSYSVVDVVARLNNGSWWYPISTKAAEEPTLKLTRVVPSNQKPKDNTVYSDNPTLKDKVIYAKSQLGNLYHVVKSGNDYSLLNLRAGSEVTKEETVDRMINTFQNFDWYAFDNLKEATAWLAKELEKK